MKSLKCFLSHINVISERFLQIYRFRNLYIFRASSFTYLISGNICSGWISVANSYKRRCLLRASYSASRECLIGCQSSNLTHDLSLFFIATTCLWRSMIYWCSMASCVQWMTLSYSHMKNMKPKVVLPHIGLLRLKLLRDWL